MRRLLFQLENNILFENYTLRIYKPLRVLLLMLFLVACSDSKPVKTAPPNIFRYNESSSVRSLDPAKARTRGERWLAAQLYNTLFEVGEDLNIYPALVKEYEWSVDRTELRLTLPEKPIYFHSPEGRKLSARDVMYSLRRALKLNPEWKQLHRFLSSQNIHAVSDREIKITLTEEFEPFLWFLTDPRLSIISPESIDKKTSVGTGPFALVHWYPDHSLKLVRHPNYFKVNFRGHPLPLLEGVYVSFEQDETRILSRFKNNEFDLAYPIQADSITEDFAFSRELLEGYI
ncbi:MAG: ABC transporter substrate-binding protein, partial [Bacteroidota bacterium]